MRGPRTAMKTGPRLPQLEKALAQKRRPNTAKNKQINKKINPKFKKKKKKIDLTTSQLSVFSCLQAKNINDLKGKPQTLGFQKVLGQEG